MTQEKRIGKTTEYKFKNLIGYNRPINEKHVKDLMQSISEEDLSPLFPIVINSNNEIIDGQHRYEALCRLQKPIYYLKTNMNFDYNGIKLVNNNQKNWRIADYVEAEIANNNLEYYNFKESCEKYNVNYNLMLSIINETSSTNMSINKMFKRGQFKMPTDNRIETFFNKLTDIERFTEFEARKNSYFIRACLKLFSKKSYEHERMISKLKNNFQMIKLSSSINEYFVQFNNIFNFNVKKEENHVFLK